jgi:hypothetical protein
MTTLRDMADRVVADNNKAFDAYAKRPGFRAWAYVGGPDENRRVAVIKDHDYPGLVWVDLHVDRGSVEVYRKSGGAFYDTGDPNDHPEGALEWAKSSARKYVEQQKSYLAPRTASPSLPPGTRKA